MSCSAPSPLIRIICTNCPSTAEKSNHLSVDGAADAKINHPALGNTRTQRIAGLGHIGDRTLIGGGRRLRRRRRRPHALSGSWSDRRRSARDEIGDHILTFGRCLHSGERHLVLQNRLLRVEQIGVERGCVPDEIGGLHGSRIIVVGHFTRFLADNAGEARSERVLAGLQRMASLTFLVNLPACCRVTAGSYCRSPGR